MCAFLLLLVTSSADAQSFDLLPPGLGASNLSDDGTTIGGKIILAPDTVVGYVWQAAGYIELEDLQGGQVSSDVDAISSDGAFLFGSSRTKDAKRPVIWTASGSVSALPMPQGQMGCPDEWLTGEVHEVAADTLVYAGVAADGGDSGECGEENRLVVWIDESIMVNEAVNNIRNVQGVATSPLRVFGTTRSPNSSWVYTESGFQTIQLPGSSPRVRAVSTDGMYVGASTSTPITWIRLRLDSTGVVQATEEFNLAVSDNITNGTLATISDDGSIMAGSLFETVDNQTRRFAAVWTESEGLQDLNEIMENLCVDLDGWTLIFISDMTPDGSVFVGTAQRTGEQRGYRVEVPPNAFGKKVADCTCQIPEIEWSGGGGSDFISNADNWLGSIAPSSTEGATFSSAGEQIVKLDTPYGLGQLLVKGSSIVDLDLAISTLEVSPPCVSLEPAHFVVGTGLGSNAQLTARNGRLELSGSPLIVGTRAGNGTFRLSEAAEFAHAEDLASITYLGLFEKGDGTIIVEDESSFYTMELNLAFTTDSRGLMHVMDSGSFFRTRSLEAGVVGVGDVLIEAGATGEIGQYMQLGQTVSGVGSVTVAGDGSVLGVGFPDSFFQIGGAGEGRLTVRDSAAVILQDNQVTLASDGGEGHVVITGDGSRLEGAGVTLVGGLGHGTLRIEEGGAMTTAQLVISNDNSSREDSLVVTGEGSRLDIVFEDDTGLIRSSVGGAGRGIGRILNGGFLNVDNNLAVGLQPDEANQSIGRLDVLGTDSRVQIDRNLYVGYRPASESSPQPVEGHVLVGDGASVTIDFATVIGFDTLLPSEDTDGHLEVIAGGSFETAFLGVGEYGTVTVGGTGASLSTGSLTAATGATISGNISVASLSVPKLNADSLVGITTTELVLQDGVQINFDSLTVSGGTIGGTLTWPRDFNYSTTLSPGDSVGAAGTFVIGGDYTQPSDATLRIDILGTEVGSFDVLDVEGAAETAGHVHLVFSPDYQPQPGDQFEIVRADTIRGVLPELVVTPEGHSTVELINNGTAIVARVIQSTSTDRAAVSVSEFGLQPNFPEPFAGQTTIVIRLPRSSHVRLTVFDLLGRKVAEVLDESLNAGEHRILFNAHDLPNGLYVTRMEAGGLMFLESMSLTR